MNTLIFSVLNGAAIVATAVVFGTDVFFSVVGKKAAAKSKDESISDLMGHFHEVADVRMPMFGFTSIITTFLQVVVAGLQTVQGQLAFLALMSLLTHLLIYLAVSKPVNKIMVDAVKFGRMINNIRELQQRWDKVISLRAVLLLIAMACLVLVNYC